MLLPSRNPTFLTQINRIEKKSCGYVERFSQSELKAGSGNWAGQVEGNCMGEKFIFLWTSPFHTSPFYTKRGHFRFALKGTICLGLDRKKWPGGKTVQIQYV
jgi:hypothetical protein